MSNKVWDEIIYPFLNFNGCTVEVTEWISNSMPHFIGRVITYPCWDWSKPMLVKGATGIHFVVFEKKVYIAINPCGLVMAYGNIELVQLWLM